jgi:O-antigen/teichoic acid export membrane protein
MGDAAPRRGLDGPPPGPATGAPASARAGEPIVVGTRRAALDIAVQVLGRLGNLALGVVVTLVIVRALGSKGFGQWSTIFAITQIASNFGDLGLGQVAVAKAAADRARESRWIGALLSLRLLLALPVALSSAVVVLAIAANQDARVAGLLIAGATLVTAPAALTAVFQLRVRNDISTAVITLNSVVWTAGVVIASLSTHSIVVFALIFLLAATVSNAATATLALRLLPIRLTGTRPLWGPLLAVGLRVGAAGVLVTLYVKLDQILVFEIAGARQAGLYGAVYRILDQIQFIPISVMTTLFPLIASSHLTDRARTRRLLQLTAEYLTMASLPILAFTIVAAHPIVELLFGAQFFHAAPALPILMAAFVSISFGYLAGNMVVILELQRLFLRYAAVGLAVNVALNLALIPSYGFLAAAWITLLTEVVVMSLTMRTVLAELQMTPQLRRLARIAIAAAAMGLLAYAARALHTPLAGLVVVALLAYPAALFLLKALSTADIQAVLRKNPV